MQTIQDINLLDLNYIRDKPGVILVNGMLGAGKTAAAFKLLELIHKAHEQKEVFYYLVDETYAPELRILLPGWIKFTNHLKLKELPRGCIVLGDESWFYFSSRVRMNEEEIKVFMDNMALARQRDQTLILIIQSLALLEIVSFRVGFTLMCKYIPIESLMFERTEFQDFLKAINAGFSYRLREYPEVTLQECVYIHTPYSFLWRETYRSVPGYNYGYYRLDLPEFWTDELSVFWSRYT